MNKAKNEEARASQQRVQTAIDKLTEVIESLHHMKVFSNGKSNGKDNGQATDEAKKDDDGPEDVPG